MVTNSNDKYDETEYHFADDQVDYEVEMETEKPTLAASGKQKLQQLRKPLIGVVVFLSLLFAIYKMLAPSPVSHSEKLSAPPAIQKEPAKVVPPVAVQANIQPVTPNTETKVVASPSSSIAPVDHPADAAMMDKLTTIEEQSTTQLGQLRNEYSQKIAEYEAQNNMMQGKLDDLSMRIATLEATITRLSQSLQELKTQPKPAPAISTNALPAEAPAVNSELTSAYTVQAIIPGRAWLKAETGETITVAEGDVIKGYGKVTKIDPYDGVVNININGRTISLSYGVGTE